MNERHIKRYNGLWAVAPLQKPEIWPSWEVIKDFAGKKCLEIGCGNHPRIPLQSGFFLDTSEAAVANLKNRGAKVYLGSAENLSFEDNFFDLAAAFEVLEHIEDDRKVLHEIHRVLKSGGYFYFSVPLGEKYFSRLDAISGHKRRYEPESSGTLLLETGFKIIKFRCPRFSLDRIPGLISLLEMIYSDCRHETYFSLPGPIINLLVRMVVFLKRCLAGPWETSGFGSLKDKREVEVLCEALKWQPESENSLPPGC